METPNAKAEFDSLEARIFRSAKELFHKKGYYATTTREIAQRAGTSETGIFRKFPSKYGLLMEVYNEAWRVVNVTIGAPKHEDPRYEIIRVFSVLADLFDKDPLTTEFILINTGNTDTLLIERKAKAIISEQNQKYIENIRSLCQTTVKQRLVVPSFTTNSLTEVILGIYEGTLLGWYLSDHSDSYPQRVTAREMIEALCHILSLKTFNPNGYARS